MIIVYFLGFAASIFLLAGKKADRKSVLILMAGSLAAFCLEAAAVLGQDGLSLTEISREGKSGSGKRVVLDAESEGEQETIEIEILPQEYSAEELEELCSELWNGLEDQIRGENASLDYVTKDLFFPKRIDGYPFTLRWESSEPALLTSEGRISADIPEEGVLTEICVHIEKEGQDFGEEHVFYAKLFPPQESSAFWERLEKTLAGTEKSTRGMADYILPESFEGRDLRFYKRRNSRSGMLFFLTMAGAAAMYAGQKREKEKQRKERAAKLEQEYPEMVSRMTMLVGAGMTISGAFRRMAGDYGKRRQETEKPLYEELLMTCREMDAGIPERTAYQNMGTRCALPCIVRFTALLIQYAKSGAGGLKRALQEETDQALKERKERARRSGEEAGTKLLLPMILLLILVMVIVMIPAFTSFGI